jgi:four helix bundle protein
MPAWSTFEEIEAWQMARDLCSDIFRIIQYQGLDHDYGLKDQINRSSGSIMDNIAEGFGRGGNREFVGFLSIARASCAEVRSQLHRIHDRQYITDEEYQHLLDKTQQISQKISALIVYLRKSPYTGPKFKKT